MGNPNPSPATRFGGSRAPARGEHTSSLVRLTQANGEVAARLRNHYLRASLQLVEDAELLREGQTSGEAATVALEAFPPAAQRHMADADRALGLRGDDPGQAPDAPAYTIRQTALALLETLRRAAAAPPDPDIVDVTPTGEPET